MSWRGIARPIHVFIRSQHLEFLVISLASRILLDRWLLCTLMVLSLTCDVPTLFREYQLSEVYPIIRLT